jgi:threonine synthase
MSLIANNDTIKSAIDILESVDEQQQKRMLYLLKLEKARPLARSLDKSKTSVKKTDSEITETIHRIRKGYGRK